MGLTSLFLIIGRYNDTELQGWGIVYTGKWDCLDGVGVQEGVLILAPLDIGVGLRLIQQNGYHLVNKHHQRL